jgi:hypothetical protein
MQIHVARHSAQLGVFTSEEITAGLRSGRFLAADLAWRDGMPAWTPLGDWPEFRPTTTPASPSALTAESPVASTIPWEQGKSLGSFFATIKLAVANPAALSTGRFAFGDWLVFCYLALAFSLPFQAIHLAIAEDPNQALGNFLKGLSYPEVQAIADQMLKSPPAPLWASGAGLVGGLAFAPLMYAFFALLHWVGQRVFRLRIAVERTVSATLLVSGALILLMAPFQLLAFSFVAQLALSALFLIPACILYFRALGAATGVNPWAQFGISCFVWSVLCCCCCFLPGMLLWGAAAAR